MPGLNAVLKAWHPMLGLDLHVPWPPGSPAPAPAPVPYITTMLMVGVVPLTTRYTTTVYTDGLAPAMVRGTDIGPMIPHLGPPSLTIAIEMLMSGSKSYFGASSVHVRDQWGAPGNLACGLLGFTNPNLNCGTPVPTPFGLVIAPTTHMETLTLGDMVAGLCLMAVDFALQALLNKVGSLAGELLSKGATAVARRLGIGVLGRTAARQMARAAGVRSNIGPAANALRTEAAERLARIGRNVFIYGFSPIGFLIGSPLGMSVSNVRDDQGNQVAPSLTDRGTGEGRLKDGHLSVEKRADVLGADADKAVNDYFNSPSAEEVPPSSPPSSGADAGVPDGDGAAGAPDAASTARDAPNASTGADAPNASMAPEAPNASTGADAPNASNVSPAPNQPNMSTPDGDGPPTGSDGSPDAPFSSPDGEGNPGSGR